MCLDRRKHLTTERETSRLAPVLRGYEVDNQEPSSAMKRIEAKTFPVNFEVVSIRPGLQSASEVLEHISAFSILDSCIFCRCWFDPYHTMQISVHFIFTRSPLRRFPWPFPSAPQATGLHGIGIRTRLRIFWIKGTVLWTVSPQPSTPQLSSLRAFLSSRSANCHR